MEHILEAFSLWPSCKDRSTDHFLAHPNVDVMTNTHRCVDVQLRRPSAQAEEAAVKAAAKAKGKQTKAGEGVLLKDCPVMSCISIYIYIYPSNGN